MLIVRKDIKEDTTSSMDEFIGKCKSTSIENNHNQVSRYITPNKRTRRDNKARKFNLQRVWRFVSFPFIRVLNGLIEFSIRSIEFSEYKDYQCYEGDFTVTACNHVFHSGCLDIWLRHQSACPFCRGKI